MNFCENEDMRFTISVFNVRTFSFRKMTRETRSKRVLYSSAAVPATSLMMSNHVELSFLQKRHRTFTILEIINNNNNNQYCYTVESAVQ